MEDFTKEMLEEIRDESKNMFKQSTRCCFIGYDGVHYFDNPKDMLDAFLKYQDEQISRHLIEVEKIFNRKWYDDILDIFRKRKQ